MKNIEELINNTIHNNELVKINDKLYLTKEQMAILDVNHINYQSCSSISEVLLLIEDILSTEPDDFDDLDEVAKSLQEFQYYHYTNK